MSNKWNNIYSTATYRHIESLKKVQYSSSKRAHFLSSSRKSDCTFHLSEVICIGIKYILFEEERVRVSYFYIRQMAILHFLDMRAPGAGWQPVKLTGGCQAAADAITFAATSIRRELQFHKKKKKNTLKSRSHLCARVNVN